MNFKKLLLAALPLAAVSAFAQAPLGTITSVSGVATVTTGTTGVATTVGAPIMNGSRVITTSTGSVTLSLNNGCTLTLPPGSGLTVMADRTCEQLRQSIQRVTTTVQSTTTTTSGGLVPAGPFFTPSAGATAVAAGAIVIGVIAATNDDDDDAPLSAR